MGISIFLYFKKEHRIKSCQKNVPFFSGTSMNDSNTMGCSIVIPSVREENECLNFSKDFKEAKEFNYLLSHHIKFEIKRFVT